jgi:release factor glutamine methyltransferase
MPETEVWTIGKLLNWTTSYLAEHGSETPRLDAELLLAHVCGFQRIQLYTAFDDVPAENVRADFRALVKRRSAGTPVAYLLGRREFYSLSFRVTPAVLIPRPETEFVVIRLLDLARVQGRERGWEIADVGTGSGILAVCAAKNLPGARLLAVDISPAALEVARENAQLHHVAERIELVESDLLAGMPAERTFDFIVSNPPYVSTIEMAELPRDVKDHEPRHALEAGPRGTEVIQRLINQATTRLRPHGYLLMEISPQLEEPVRALLEQAGTFDEIQVTKDLAGLARVVQARQKA